MHLLFLDFIRPTLPKKTSHTSALLHKMKRTLVIPRQKLLALYQKHSLFFWTVFRRHANKWPEGRRDVCHSGNKTLRSSVPPTPLFYLFLNWCSNKFLGRCRTSWKTWLLRTEWNRAMSLENILPGLLNKFHANTFNGHLLLLIFIFCSITDLDDGQTQLKLMNNHHGRELMHLGSVFGCVRYTISKSIHI